MNENQSFLDVPDRYRLDRSADGGAQAYPLGTSSVSPQAQPLAFFSLPLFHRAAFSVIYSYFFFLFLSFYSVHLAIFQFI